MQTKVVNGIPLHYADIDEEAADIVAGALAETITLLQASWQLAPPADCQVVVMTSWQQFMFDFMPPGYKVIYTLTRPIWIKRVEQTWELAGGWNLNYGKRCVAGVKPPRLLEQADRSIGERIFVREEHINEKVCHITCHELTHAFSGHLRLPMWLNEGLAMVAVDRLLQKQSVLPETIEALRKGRSGVNSGSYRHVKLDDQDTVVYHYVRGYWITRYLEDKHPGLLTGLLTKRRRKRDLETSIADQMKLSLAAFWDSIDSIVLEHYG